MKKKLVLGLSLSYLFLSTVTFASPSHYALIVDAGSTGSRLHLFEYHQGKNLPEIRELFTESIKPGLSSFENTPQEAGLSLKLLIEHADEALKKLELDPQKIPLSILGTAGMRLLAAEKQAAIYKELETYLQKNQNHPLLALKTISGKMEGLYGWLALNYLLKRFEGPQDVTLGSIDMGGASTQIVFSTQDRAKAEDEVELSLAGKNYTVFSKSFLGLGLLEAFRSISQNPQAASCYPTAYTLDDKSGQFSKATCSALYQELIDDHQVTVQLPKHDKTAFIAYAGVYYVEHFFGVDKTPSKLLLEQNIETICNKNWEEFKKDHAALAETQLEKYCANGVYLSKLLYDNYQLHEDLLQVNKQVAGQDLEWALGALLYDLNS